MGDLVQIVPSAPPARRPAWLRVRIPGGDNYFELKRLMRGLEPAHGVRERALPQHRRMLGTSHGNVHDSGRPLHAPLRLLRGAEGPPRRAGGLGKNPSAWPQAAATMGLKYVVVTSVDRDDLKDGGATIFALTIDALRRQIPQCKVEVLIPDFRGSDEALETVLRARPDILNHNIETVPRLYPVARRGSHYERSLRLLRRSRELDPSIPTKSGLMVGLGETMDELYARCSAT